MNALDALQTLIRRALSKVDYYKAHGARVVSQSSDKHHVDLIPDDPNLPHMQDVPIRHGFPGVKFTIRSGARVRVWFDDGDPAKPFVGLWDAGDVEDVAFAGGTSKVALVGSPVLIVIGAAAVAQIAKAVAAPTGAPSITVAGHILAGAAKTAAG